MLLVWSNNDTSYFTFVSSVALADRRASFSRAESRVGPTVPGLPRRWTEHSVRKLLGLLYGDQEKLLKFLVEHGGTATYAEGGQHMRYDGQRLSGILSPLTRNAKTATQDDSAQIIHWRPSEHPGQRIYFVNPEALPLLKEELSKSSG
jgi:hypothetical protein